MSHCSRMYILIRLVQAFMLSRNNISMEVERKDDSCWLKPFLYIMWQASLLTD